MFKAEERLLTLNHVVSSLSLLHAALHVLLSELLLSRSSVLAGISRMKKRIVLQQ